MLADISFADLLADKAALVAVVLLGLFVILALIAPWVAPYDPSAMDLEHLKEPPSSAHLLGTDGTGRDILSRMLYGARISLAVGILASALSLAIGICFGLIAGYF